METIKQRADIDPRYKWKLTDIYESDALWEQDFAQADGHIKKVAAFSGKLTDAEDLLAALSAMESAQRVIETLFVYARMRRDEDNALPLYQAFADRAMQKMIALESSGAYFAPELLALGREKVEGFIRALPALAPYRRHLHQVLRMEAHTLPAEQEQLLAQISDLAQAPDTIFSMLTDADFKFGMVPDGKGGEMELTQGRYIMLMESPDRAVRKAAYEALYKQYKAYVNTISATYAASVKKDIFFARVRKYASSREEAMDASEIPVGVYDALIEAVHRHLPAMHRYLALRKKLLKVDTLHYYDIYVPIIPDVDMGLPFDDALRMVLSCLEPLGKPYVDDLSHAFTQGWMDVYETPNKTSGAYAWGAYGTHPYVLLNYNDTLDNLFTLAHELGHAMHSYYSNKNQPFMQADYPLFLAEIASTTNEAIVMASLMEKTQDAQQLMALCNHQLEQIRGTVFRQTLFAEFERTVHEKAMAGEALTAELLTGIYRDLNNLYYAGIEMDGDIAYEWMRIPHFYRAFYVYQYATGYSAAVALSRKVLSGNTEDRDRYLGFLAAGNSKPALDILRDAGVDMESPEPVEACLLAFEETLDRLEKLLEEIK